MPDRVVYFNGRFVPEAEARVPLYDSALLMGDMAFEVTRTYGHRPFHLADHIDRLFHSLAVLQIDPGLSRAELLDATEQTLARNLATAGKDVDWNIIHNVSRGPSRAFAEAFDPEDFHPTVLVSCYPLTVRLGELASAYIGGIDLVVPSQRALPTALLDASIKTRSRVHYQLANLQAAQRQPGAVAILVDTDGLLTEGTNGNLFLVRGGALCTPEPRNLLPGITRNVVLALARRLGIPAAETNLTPADALAADELFVTSTTIGILHARSFEGHTIGNGQIGKVTTQLRQALIAEVGLDFVAQAQHYARQIVCEHP